MSSKVYTSQLFAAHLYLDGLDQRVKRVLKVPGYVRYVDDLFVFGDPRADLSRWRGEVALWLEEERTSRGSATPGGAVAYDRPSGGLACRGCIPPRTTFWNRRARG